MIFCWYYLTGTSSRPDPLASRCTNLNSKFLPSLSSFVGPTQRSSKDTQRSSKEVMTMCAAVLKSLGTGYILASHTLRIKRKGLVMLQLSSCR